jgi:hypothetical protein
VAAGNALSLEFVVFAGKEIHARMPVSEALAVFYELSKTCKTPETLERAMLLHLERWVRRSA